MCTADWASHPVSQYSSEELQTRYTALIRYWIWSVKFTHAAILCWLIFTAVRKKPKLYMWHMAAGRGKVQVLEKMRDWTKEIRLNPEELRKVVCLLKENSGQRLLHNVAGSGKVELLEELWDWAKKLQLISEKLRKKVFVKNRTYRNLVQNFRNVRDGRRNMWGFFLVILT